MAQVKAPSLMGRGTWSLAALDHRVAGILGRRAELLLDADQLVVLGQAIRAGERTGLDLTAVERDGEVGNGRILGFTRTVRHDRGVAGAVRGIDGVERLGQR